MLKSFSALQLYNGQPPIGISMVYLEEEKGKESFTFQGCQTKEFGFLNTIGPYVKTHICIFRVSLQKAELIKTCANENSHMINFHCHLKGGR